MMSILESSVWDVDAKGLTYDRQFRSAHRNVILSRRPQHLFLMNFRIVFALCVSKECLQISVVECCFEVDLSQFVTQVIEILFNKNYLNNFKFWELNVLLFSDSEWHMQKINLFEYRLLQPANEVWNKAIFSQTSVCPRGRGSPWQISPWIVTPVH